MIKFPPERFWDACGAAGPLHLDVVPPGGAEATPRILPRPFAVIGRDAGMDIALDHEAVSKRHAYLQVVGGRIFCVDLGSRTGVFGAGGGEGSGWLEPDRPLRIGPFEIRLPPGGRGGTADDPRATPPADPLSSRPAGRDELPAVALGLRDGSKEHPPWSMDRTLVLLGRAPGCKMRFKSASVSRFHCSLIRTPAGVWVVDLFGREGIAINGRAVRFAQLEDGDELKVGRFLIGVRCTPPAAGASLPALRGSRPGPPGVRGPAAGTPAIDRRRPGAGIASSPAGQVPQQAELLGPSVTPLFEQLGQMQRQMFDQVQQGMQRQMFDQFQQVMTTVLQMFTTMHRDQVGLLREEIDGLRRLTQELHELRAEPPARGGGTPDVPLTGSAEATSPERPRLPASGPRPDPDPAQDRAGPPSALGTTSRQAGRAEEPPEVHSLAEGPARTARDSGGPGDPAVRSDAEFHVLLTRRIAAIQQEQQSRWQRILGLVTGPKQGGPTL